MNLVIIIYSYLVALLQAYSNSSQMHQITTEMPPPLILGGNALQESNLPLPKQYTVLFRLQNEHFHRIFFKKLSLVGSILGFCPTYWINNASKRLKRFPRSPQKYSQISLIFSSPPRILNIWELWTFCKSLLPGYAEDAVMHVCFE